MRFPTFTAGIVCLVNLASAQPAPGSPDDACCCCDISRNVIACSRSILKADCVCAAVACPEGAKTVWDNDKATSTVMEADRMSVLPIKEGGVMTILPVKGDERLPILPVNEESQMTILPVEETVQPPQLAKTTGKREANDNADDACCCCDISKRAISCCRSLKKDQCACAAVQCPKNAPIIWEDGTPVGSEAADKPALVLSELPKDFVTAAKGVEKAGEITNTPTRRYPCCCCNIGIGKMVCEVRNANNCICPMVVCPQNADTIFVEAASPTDII